MANLNGREKDNHPDEDATSKETLSEVEGTQKVSSGSAKPNVGPSPDGAFDEQEEKKDAGPM